MNIAQEVFIDHEPSTITYEVGFRQSQVEAEQNAEPGIMEMSFVRKIKEYFGFRCEKLTRALTQCFLVEIAPLDKYDFYF